VTPAGIALPKVTELLAVCAHPDDESFGLGGVLGSFVEQGARVRVLCFTHGEASTLGVSPGQLGELREQELDDAARVLGVTAVRLHGYPDGHLAEVLLEELTALVDEEAADAELLLTFDEGGITGHPDHVRATQAALALGASRDLPVLGWALPQVVAAQLNPELGTTFVGRRAEELDFTLEVDRARQREAIACHQSQSSDNPILSRRLQLLGGGEHLRWLRPPAGDAPGRSTPSIDDSAGNEPAAGDARGSPAWSAAGSRSRQEAW
jgi:LmbE family N-acetylglucosaminyl deacetylase